ncbi:hypothetical protein [Dyella monticola]|uniref:hypothetical protein n=1 Tax=Dyella monticola TaxID=1927958 RepID=UPI0011C056D0|nr:hypothetical protein [Dyella monticola]
MFLHVTERLPIHPDDAVRPSAMGPNEHGSNSPRPASATSSIGFPTTPSTGRPSGLLSTLHNPSFEPKAVRLPGDATTYYVKNPSNTKTPQSLYTRDPDTGVLKQTSKQIVDDGKDGWQIVDGLKGGGDKEDKQLLLEDESSGSEDADIAANTALPPLPSRRTPSTSQSSSQASNSGASGLGPVPDSRYLHESGDGQSQHWFISDDQGGNKQADSSIDKFAWPARRMAQGEFKGKRQWRGPDASAYSGGPSSERSSPFLPPGDSARHGPAPDPRYLTKSGDGKSRHWVISNRHGGYKPADSSIDKYGTPLSVFLNGKFQGKGLWKGPSSSVKPPAP